MIDFMFQKYGKSRSHTLTLTTTAKFIWIGGICKWEFTFKFSNRFNYFYLDPIPHNKTRGTFIYLLFRGNKLLHC